MTINARSLLIINPHSGTRSKSGLEQEARDAIPGVEVVYTQRAGHATELARQAADDGYDRVIAAGGDGTVNETARGLLGTPAAMGIVPLGSGNGLARHLRIPMDTRRALRVAAEARSLTVDTAEVEGRPFFCTMGIGFDAAVSAEFAAASRRGLLTYTRIAMARFAAYRPEPCLISVDGMSLECQPFILAICNASQYGNNAYIAPGATMRDGLLDITIVRPGHLPLLAAAGVRLFTHSLEGSSLVHTLRGRTVTVRRPAPGPAHLDGEAVTLPDVFTATVCPLSLHVIAPA